MRNLFHHTGRELVFKMGWRQVLLLVIVIGSLAVIMSLQPIKQNLHYHDFGDRRAFFGIPNFFDVLTNMPFLLVGMAGVHFCWGRRALSFRLAWLTFFTGVAMVSAGSGYYHWHPNNDTLVWDRLPMTVAFMGLFAALLAEYVSAKLGKYLLAPAILAGLFSVYYWHWFDDLRFYVWIQFVPLLTIPFLMGLFRPKYSRQWLLLVALGCYMLAKLLEFYDGEVFNLTQSHFSGHSFKHLLAALGCLFILAMLKTRKSVGYSFLR
ncbi:MAG: alkaline phytoceramidase [Gallionella sp.]|nr:alkaline phytoceramidase [Gallionella sp.]MDD4960179.1 alkaline phytoceramidase [Gallionella sp.]